MDFKEVADLIQLGGAGILVGVFTRIGYVIWGVLSGREKSDKEYKQALSARIKELQEVDAAQDEEIKKYKDRIEYLEILRNENAQTINNLMNILQNRSPDLDNKLNVLLQNQNEILKNLHNSIERKL